MLAGVCEHVVVEEREQIGLAYVDFSSDEEGRRVRAELLLC